MKHSWDESTARFQVDLTFRVQGYDIDLAGIVSNIVYVRWLEDLRQAFCDTHYPTEEMIAKGFIPVLRSTQIDYKRAVLFSDRVRGRIRFEDFRGPKWNFAFEILANEETAAVATQTGVFMTLADRRIYRIPKDMVERFR